MICMTINMKALSEKRTELIQTLMGLMDATTQCKGCIDAGAWVNIKDDDQINIVEIWENENQLKHHLKTKVFGALTGAFNLLCVSRKIQCFDNHNPDKIRDLLNIGEH